ncbi:hypothetical protein Ahy_A02g009398 [Arachis hypogaea]|uniref:Uncharacterized protein n=1 Tax=Arachis hypogaea TaxID=3818 RepID=A0A445EGW4_ARAHY|nr:hypothetical protein Ahy_A02g009398 [Arachis hypogaea]
MVVEKNTYSAFRKSGLEEKLVEMKIKEVTGVIPTCAARPMRERHLGFGAFFSSDATATSDEEIYDAILKNMAYGFTYMAYAQLMAALHSKQNAEGLGIVGGRLGGAGGKRVASVGRCRTG